ncbi:MAG: ATP-binding cassette domain-containing protein, partial [Myxococcota bacterium]
RDFKIKLHLEWQTRSLVLFGASGSGKTTLLRILLGLEPLAKTRACLAGNWLEDSKAGFNRPIHERRLGWVPQSPSLFPDRPVHANIRFGAHGKGRESWINRAIEVLELHHLLDRQVESLSGGERQRVALARAIAMQPRALLLDEPLASLDVGLRARILPYLLRIRDELDLPLVYITHDPDEAILLGDEIAVLDKGRLIAQGPPAETLWSQAVHSLSARVGVENLLEVTQIADESAEPTLRVRTANGLELETPWPVAAEAKMVIGIRAEDILISLDHPRRISARNVLRGRVARIDAQSDRLLVYVEIGRERLIARLTASAVQDLALATGSQVYLIIKSQALRRIR